jgi:hypothetical protein
MPADVASASGADAAGRGRPSLVTVNVSRDDLKKIADRELYTHIIIYECGAETVRYPAVPSFAGTSLHDFDELRSAVANVRGEETVQISGEVIQTFLRRLRDPCVRLQGGNMTGARLSSNSKPLRIGS